MTIEEVKNITSDNHFPELIKNSLEKIDIAISDGCDMGDVSDYEWMIQFETGNPILLLNYDNVIIENDEEFIFEAGSVQIGMGFERDFRMTGLYLKALTINPYSASGNYVIPHGSHSGFTSVCFGSTDTNRLYQSLTNGFTLNEEQLDQYINKLSMFVSMIREWIEYESIEGGPYHELKDTIQSYIGNNFSSSSSTTLNIDSHFTGFFEFLKDQFKSEKLPYYKILGKMFNRDTYLSTLVSKYIYDKEEDYENVAIEDKLLVGSYADSEVVCSKKMIEGRLEELSKSCSHVYRNGKYQPRSWHLDNDLFSLQVNNQTVNEFKLRIENIVKDYIVRNNMSQSNVSKFFNNLRFYAQPSLFDTYPDLEGFEKQYYDLMSNLEVKELGISFERYINIGVCIDSTDFKQIVNELEIGSINTSLSKGIINRIKHQIDVHKNDNTSLFYKYKSPLKFMVGFLEKQIQLYEKRSLEEHYVDRNIGVFSKDDVESITLIIHTGSTAEIGNTKQEIGELV